MKEKIYNDPDIGEVRFRKTSRSRRINLRVHPSRGISVSIPWFMRYDDGMRFYLQKRDWVRSVLARQKERQDSAEQAGFAIPPLHDGVVVSTLLSRITFVRDTPAAARQDGRLRISISTETIEDVQDTGRLFLSPDRPVSEKTVRYPDNAPAEGSEALSEILRNALLKILRDEAKTLLPARFALLASRYGFRYGTVTIKHNVSNWGSCSTRGNINLNLNLIRLPEPVCDYVLLHEMAHLRHHDHGGDFHDLLERLCADNMSRLSALGDPYVTDIIRLAGKSRAARPWAHVLETQVKKFRLV